MLPKKKLTKPTGYFLSTDCNRKNDMKKNYTGYPTSYCFIVTSSEAQI